LEERDGPLLIAVTNGHIKLGSSMKSVSPQSQLGMSQQKVQQRVQEREKVLKEIQQAVESLKVSIIIDQRRCTFYFPPPVSQ
jgi:hypothetical protein